MEYQVVATLGPASCEASTWHAMLDAGASAFRINTSHLSLDQIERWLEQLAAFNQARGKPAPVVLDLQGSKWRLGQFEACELIEGQRLTLVHAAACHDSASLPVPHADFFKAIQCSDGDIVLNDAKSRLAVEAVAEDSVSARVTLGGWISANKGITLSSSNFRIEALSAKDRRIAEQFGNLDSVSLAISYVRDAAELANYRVLLPQSIKLAVKLERQEAVQDAQAISALADEVWLCRGDLGAEMGLKGMAEAVRCFGGQLERLAKPALLAGQVLEHLTEHATPTRAEVCAMYDALVSGYTGLVLSDETAVGVSPVEACRVAAMFRGQ